jgi:ADP-heptose:LPS heptosyltransferase
MKQKIIIPIFSGIGNSLLAVPLVQQLKKQFPDCCITVLAGSSAIGEVFNRLNDVKNVIITSGGTTGLMKTGLALRFQRCDILLIPSPSRRWQYLLMATGINAHRTIMHSYTERQSLIRRALRFETVPARYGLHDVDQNLLLLHALTPGTTPDSNRKTAPVFPLREADHNAAEALLQSAGINIAGEKPIIVHAGCGVTALAAAKRWPPAHCNHLLHALIQHTGRKIILIEGPDEPGLADEILCCKPVEGVAVIRVRGNLGTSAALLQRAGLFIGSDSGLAHLAAAVGTPPVTLFGPADPDRMCPFGYRHLVVQASSQRCHACNRYPWAASSPKITCDRNYACMRDITTDDIMEKALPLLQSSK